MTMLLSLILAASLTVQAGADPFAEAERLARTGDHREALTRFQDWAASHPEDLGARVWIGRLHLWMGHPDRAEAVFRGILAAAPAQIEAKLGLGHALLAEDRPEDALDVFEQAERLALTNAEVLAAVGRAHAILGHTARALAYYRRAAALAPANGDIRTAYEHLRMSAGHRIEMNGFDEQFSQPTPRARSVDATVSFRLSDRWRIGARGQHQDKFSMREDRGGLTGEWRMTRNLTWTTQMLYGGRARVLPRADAMIDGTYGRGRLETSGLVRHIAFSDARVSLLSPGLSVWLRDSWNVSGRYYLSLTDYPNRHGLESAHSGAVRTQYRVLPRVWADLGYARGTESFETLSFDRLGRFRAGTASAGFRWNLPSLTTVAGAYEYQWRTTNSRMQRATISIVQRF